MVIELWLGKVRHDTGERELRAAQPESCALDARLLAQKSHLAVQLFELAAVVSAMNFAIRNGQLPIDMPIRWRPWRCPFDGEMPAGAAGFCRDGAVTERCPEREGSVFGAQF